MSYFNIPMGSKRMRFKVDDIVYLTQDLPCFKAGELFTIVGMHDHKTYHALRNLTQKRFFLYDDEIELYVGVNPMALKFKIGDLVKTTVTVGLDFQAFPVDSEATVKELIPRAGIGYPYIIHLTKYNRDVAVMEKEIEFANGPMVIPKTIPTYHKLISGTTYAIVQDNHGTHYTVLDSNDTVLVKGHKYNKTLFVNFKEDTSYIHTSTKSNLFGGFPSIKDLMDDTALPQGQGNAIQAKPNVCTCGVEKACGPNGRHSSWCDKESKNKVGV